MLTIEAPHFFCYLLHNLKLQKYFTIPRIPISKIKTLPDIFSHITYKEVAEAIKMNPQTLRDYVGKTPEYFSLGQVYKMAEFLEVDKWWLLEKVHGWCGERAD